MASGYTITGVTQTSSIGPTGNLVDSVEVTFELDNGAGSGTVTVPLTDTWEQDAAAAVQARAQSMLNLLAL